MRTKLWFWLSCKHPPDRVLTRKLLLCKAISLKQQAINDLELARTVESLPDFDLILAALNTIPGK